MTVYKLISKYHYYILFTYIILKIRFYKDLYSSLGFYNEKDFNGVFYED